MNTLEPEGGQQSGHRTLTIQVLSSSGNPWVGAITHNQQIHRLDTSGKARLKINGGEVYANGKVITRAVREAVQQGVAEIVLQHDMGTGNLKQAV